jgi:hypothetical protein
VTASLNWLISRLIVVLAFSLIVACTDQGSDPGSEGNINVVQMEVFKQPSCECCGKWVDHLESAGFTVKTTKRMNLDAIKREFDIDPRYQSCHTGVVDGYVFEGHIPASLIQQFLEEKPGNARGLAVPGMPIGSPGMEMGERYDSYDVLLLKNDGTSEVYAHIDGSQ